MDDEDTLDEPEDLLEQARKAASKNQNPDTEPPDDDHTIPAQHDDDVTIPADQGAPSPPAEDDDETIDVDPALIAQPRAVHSSPP